MLYKWHNFVQSKLQINRFYQSIQYYGRKRHGNIVSKNSNDSVNFEEFLVKVLVKKKGIHLVHVDNISKI